mmetsp:Transcript_30489/g.47377  ORF Transcript_30489/g.47377 Transcript_30489/m.47377 type:complete len:82 (+) Transcript_30489:782-1027(+)
MKVEGPKEEDSANGEVIRRLIKPVDVNGRESGPPVGKEKEKEEEREFREGKENGRTALGEETTFCIEIERHHREDFTKHNC